MIEVNRLYGKDYADNNIDELLQFNIAQTWVTSSGTGSGVLDTTQRFEGVSSLKIENTAPTTDLKITNAVQNTVIDYAGNYALSFMLLKNELDEELTLDVEIFKNAVLLGTETAILGSETDGDPTNNLWVRFQSSANYTFAVSDLVTFTFTLKGKPGTALPLTRLWVDGMMLCDTKRLSKVVPPYTKPTSKIPTLPSADGNYQLTVSSGVYTWTEII